MGQCWHGPPHTCWGFNDETLYAKEVRQSAMSGIDDDRTLRRGQQRLLLHAGKEADPAWDTTTPSEITGHQDEMGRLEEVLLGR
jgi:phosphatidylinositol 3-kinase